MYRVSSFFLRPLKIAKFKPFDFMIKMKLTYNNNPPKEEWLWVAKNKYLKFN